MVELVHRESDVYRDKYKKNEGHRYISKHRRESRVDETAMRRWVCRMLNNIQVKLRLLENTIALAHQCVIAV
jgi:hypothetical protein